MEPEKGSNPESTVLTGARAMGVAVFSVFSSLLRLRAIRKMPLL